MKKYILLLIGTVLQAGIAQCQCIPSARTVLDINNVTAPIDNDGSIGTHANPFVSYTIDTGNGNISAGLAMGLWIGGLDDNGQLHLAAMRFGQMGNDYFPGPLNINTALTYPAICAQYDRIWKLNRWQVDEFIARQGETGYVIPQEILQWPAHGDVSSGIDFNLAPYYDADGSGNYDPLTGDYPYFNPNDGTLPSSVYPYLNGDQSAWWVMNDAGGLHTESGGEPIGLEIRCIAYAFDECGPLDNTTFYRYEVINRGSLTLHNTYIGVWVDADLGSTQDEFVQCDVQRNLGFSYDVYPDAGRAAFGIDLLTGPFRDNDGLDNDNDGIIDNEHLPMTKFLFHINSIGNQAQTAPSTAQDHYNYLQGIWKDGQPMCYGNAGHPNGGCDTGVQADFMFPGNSDSAGIGTGGVPQPTWNEAISANVPGNRRFLVSSGPFTMQPGSVNDFHYAAIWAKAPTAQLESGAIEEADDIIQAAFDAGFANLPCCPPNASIHLSQPSINQFFFASMTSGDEYFWDFGDGWTSTQRFPPAHHYIDNQVHTVMLVVSNACGSDTAYIQAGTVFFGVEEQSLAGVELYPNPNNGSFSISYSDSSIELLSLRVYDAIGALMLIDNHPLNVPTVQLNVPAGLYLVEIITNRGPVMKRCIVN